jgi:hypothetical protein
VEVGVIVFLKGECGSFSRKKKSESVVFETWKLALTPAEAVNCLGHMVSSHFFSRGGSLLQVLALALQTFARMDILHGAVRVRATLEEGVHQTAGLQRGEAAVGRLIFRRCLFCILQFCDYSILF